MSFSRLALRDLMVSNWIKPSLSQTSLSSATIRCVNTVISSWSCILVCCRRLFSDYLWERVYWMVCMSRVSEAVWDCNCSSSASAFSPPYTFDLLPACTAISLLSASPIASSCEMRSSSNCRLNCPICSSIRQTLLLKACSCWCLAEVAS